MSAIRLNGQYVLLQDVERKSYFEFVNLVMPKITPDEPIPQTAATVLAGLLAEGKDQRDALVQAGFHACASLGIKNMWTDGATATITEEVATDAAQGLETAFGFAAIESGLATVAAMCNAFRRVIRVNETEVKVLRQPRELMMKIAQAVSANKGVNEPVFVTAGRLLGSMIREGKTLEDPETMTVLCMLSDLGATALFVDVEKGQLGFGGFSTANAMSSAILQGLDVEKVKQVRESIVKTNQQFRQVVERQQAGAQGAAKGPDMRIPAVMGTRRRR
ncbi:MAG: hypothetical protein RI967_151 [Planctomycetota bacterium]|jgi:hypothetical protein